MRLLILIPFLFGIHTLKAAIYSATAPDIVESAWGVNKYALPPPLRPGNLETTWQGPEGDRVFIRQQRHMLTVWVYYQRHKCDDDDAVSGAPVTFEFSRPIKSKRFFEHRKYTSQRYLWTTDHNLIENKSTERLWRFDEQISGKFETGGMIHGSFTTNRSLFGGNVKCHRSLTWTAPAGRLDP